MHLHKNLIYQAWMADLREDGGVTEGEAGGATSTKIISKEDSG